VSLRTCLFERVFSLAYRVAWLPLHASRFTCLSLYPSSALSRPLSCPRTSSCTRAQHTIHLETHLWMHPPSLRLLCWRCVRAGEAPPKEGRSAGGRGWFRFQGSYGKEKTGQGTSVCVCVHSRDFTPRGHSLHTRHYLCSSAFLNRRYRPRWLVLQALAEHLPTHTCMHCVLHPYPHTRMHAYMLTRACIHAQIHACTHAYMHACIHARMCTSVRACMHMRMYAYARTRAHTRTHTHTCVCVCVLY